MKCSVWLQSAEFSHRLSLIRRDWLCSGIMEEMYNTIPTQWKHEELFRKEQSFLSLCALLAEEKACKEGLKVEHVVSTVGEH